MKDLQEPTSATLVYDGECPFCSRYVDLLRFRQAVGTVQLVDARNGGQIVSEVLKQGFDLDDGMVLILGNNMFHGADCIHRLSMMTTQNTLFNKFNGMVFRSRTASRMLYPILRCGRNATLRLLGRSTISGG